MIKNVTIVVLLLLLCGVVFFYYTKKEPQEILETRKEFSADEITRANELAALPNDQEYVHPKYNFAFKHPKGFTVNSTLNEAGEMLIVQNSMGEGFQMRVQEIDEDIKEITVDMIRRDIPDIVITEPQDLLIGESGKGVAFLSDDPAFDGRSREIWFVHKKVFYQISTFEKYDGLMKNIFATWQFR